MDISLRIKDVGDAKLFLQPKKEICENDEGKANEFILVRCQEDFESLWHFILTIRNGWNGIVKWMKYVRRVS